MAASLVCIAHGASAPGELAAVLHGEGVELRVANDAAADLVIFSRAAAGAAVACIDGTTPGALERVRKAVATYQRTFVLAPQSTMDDEAFHEGACRLGVAANLSFVAMPMGATFHGHALRLARAVLKGAAGEEAWAQEQAERVQSCDAVARALAALPLAANDAEDALHRARTLCMLGSISDISRSSAQQLAACAGLPHDTAVALEALFADAAQHAAAPPAEQAARPMLSL